MAAEDANPTPTGTTAAPGPTPAPAGAELPPRDGDAPLHELERDSLSVFLYVSFTGEELTALLRELRVTLPGYRMESLGDAARADIIADEIRARPQARLGVIAQLRAIYEFPALEGIVLPPAVSEEIGALAVEEDATIRMLWRLLADPSPQVRATATRPLQALAAAYYGPVDKSGAPPPAAAKSKRATSPAVADAQLKKQAERATKEAEHFKQKNEELKAQLKAARTELADLQRAASLHRKTAERLTAQVEKAPSAKQAKVSELRAEVASAEKHAGGLERRVDTLEERQRAHAEERARLEEELEEARRALQELKDAPPTGPVTTPEDLPSEALPEAPSTWFQPYFSKEFYDSLEGWEPRIQRTAFKRAMLLADNHRHPSLRAIPLEGLPSYFRVRVATDVRLIYRRNEEGAFEILSVIDREDLDRYVRQAKTRGE